jgi:hypothetical protein
VLVNRPRKRGVISAGIGRPPTIPPCATRAKLRRDRRQERRPLRSFATTPRSPCRGSAAANDLRLAPHVVQRGELHDAGNDQRPRQRPRSIPAGQRGACGDRTAHLLLSVRPKQILPNLASQRFSAPDSEWPVGTNGTRCNFFRPKSRLIYYWSSSRASLAYLGG